MARRSRAKPSVALGPWSDLVFRPLGYSIPLGVKRGYHLHLAPRGNAVLNHPMLDTDLGYMLAPMNRGIRLTTGVEFARRGWAADADPARAGRCRGPARCFRWETRSMQSHGWARGRVCRICCR
jgi:D-amino-acid dehydrogenase